MNALRINRKDTYEMVVNDKGETIVFDIADVDLPLKFKRALDKIEAIKAELTASLKEIPADEETDEIFGKNAQTAYEIMSKAFADMRDAMDEVFGKGGMRKIFGDTNYLTMYDDLFDAFEEKDENGLSHFDKMQLSREGFVNRITEKYGKKKDDEVL